MIIENDKPKEKQCCRCKTTLPFTSEHFPVHNKCKWGLETACRKCTCKRAKTVNLTERNKLRIEILKKYSKKDIPECQCCGETILEFLTLDHINGGGTEERKKYPATMLFRKLRRENFPNGYRTLCYNCNCSLGRYGYCPHQKQ